MFSLIKTSILSFSYALLDDRLRPSNVMTASSENVPVPSLLALSEKEFS